VQSLLEIAGRSAVSDHPSRNQAPRPPCGVRPLAAEASQLRRRLDWRFLLPEPHLRRVLHVGPRASTLARALETFSDSVTFADPGTGPDKPADLIVAQEASGPEVEAMLPRLSHGGWLYWELRAGQTLQPADRVWLERRGIPTVRTFWHSGGFENRRWIIPIDEPTGLAMLLRRRFPNVAPAVLRNIAAQLTRSHTIRRRLAVSVIGCRGPERGRPFPERFIETHGGDIRPTPTGSPSAYVVATPNFPSSRSVVFLMRPDTSCQPTVVAKIARAECDGRPLACEATNLRAVERAQVGVEAPRLIAHGLYERHAVLLESALPGPLMQPRLVRHRPAPCLEAGLQWIEQFHRATRVPACSLPGRLALVVKSQLKQLEPLMADEPPMQALLLRVRRETGRLDSLNMPLVFEHGDLSSPNVLWLGNGRIGVLDWELSDPRGLPAVDLFFFLAFIAFARERATSPEQCVTAFRRAFFGPDAWTHPYIARYARSVGVPKTALTPLFLLCWSRYLANLPARMAWAVDRRLTRAELAEVRRDRYWHLWKYAAEHVDDLQYAF
jgi:aminoglycoside phosphotransferase